MSDSAGDIFAWLTASSAVVWKDFMTWDEHEASL